MPSQTIAASYDVCLTGRLFSGRPRSSCDRNYEDSRYTECGSRPPSGTVPEELGSALVDHVAPRVAGLKRGSRYGTWSPRAARPRHCRGVARRVRLLRDIHHSIDRRVRLAYGESDGDEEPRNYVVFLGPNYHTVAPEAFAMRRLWPATATTVTRDVCAAGI